jgi:hypothetical protein
MPQQDPYAAIAKPDKADPYASIAVEDATEETATGIRVPKGMVGSDKDSVLGGGARRIGEILSGAYHTLADPPTEEEQKRGYQPQSKFEEPKLVADRIGRGIVAGEKQAAGQVKEQFQAAGAATDPVMKGLGYARAGVTAASMVDPFATGPVTNVNRLSDEGRYKEALGAGTVDALSLLAGRSNPLSKDLSTEVSASKRLSKMAYATGAKGLGTIRPLDDIMPDLDATIRRTIPDPSKATIGQVETALQATMTDYDQTFNKGLATTHGNVNATPIADALEAKARTLPRTAAAEAQALRKAAIPYRHPDWTPQELNQERMLRQGYLESYYKKSGTGQMHAMRSDADTMIDKVVYDESKNVLYDEMERQHPGEGYRELKQKQSSILEMQDHLKNHIKRLEAEQTSRKGAPWYDKVGASTSIHGGGPTPRLHVTEALKPGPLSRANAAVQRAYSPARGAARTSILGLPVSSITLQRGATVPPVPQGDEDEGPQQE